MADETPETPPIALPPELATLARELSDAENVLEKEANAMFDRVLKERLAIRRGWSAFWAALEEAGLIDDQRWKVEVEPRSVTLTRHEDE